MTDRDHTTDTASDRTFRERLSHSARIARVAFQRRDDDAPLDREAARRLTMARLHLGAML
jgi:hypothetical protein